MESKGFAGIEITTFINPHLFWIINRNEERSQLLKKLNKQMHDSHIHKNENDIFEVGEIVLASINEKLYRATVEDVEENYDRHIYLLWLIDYGTLRESTIVYKLPTSLRKTPALSIQASLNGVVYLEQLIEYDNSGQVLCAKKHTLKPTHLSRQICMKHLTNSHDLQFNFEKKEDGIEFGDVQYQDKDNNQVSLRKVLIEEGILEVDEKLFEGISEFIYAYKENHLIVISKICDKEPYPLEEAEDITQKTSMNIVSKVLDEFDYNDLLDFEDEYSQPLWHLNRSKNDTLTSLDNTISDSETPNKNKSKKRQLMEKFWKQKSSETSSINKNMSHESTDDSTSEKQSNASSSKTASSSKIKRLCEKMKHQITKAKDGASDPVEAKMKRKIIFSPAGSERSFIHHSLPKQSSASRYYTSDDSSSEPKRVINRRKNNSFTYTQKAVSSTTEEIKTEEDSLTENSVGSFVEEPSNEDEKSSLMEESSSSQENTCNNLQPVGTLKIKPHCSCRQCNVWTKDENVLIEKLPKHRKLDKVVGVNDKLLFKENEDAKTDVHIWSIDFSSMNKVEKQAMPKLLVHSESILNPIQHISKVAFDKRIFQNLHRLDYREAKRIQAYAWPAIFRNQHVFMINGPQSGKTTAYLPVMCTFVLEKHDRYNSLLKVAGGPIVIILCMNTHKCEEIYDLAKVFLGSIKLNVTLATYPLVHVNTSHTDMLITTPNILVELVKNKSINFKRLCHLIIEDGDMILQKYKDSISAVFDLAQSMLKNRVFTKALQLIICAEHWNSQLRHLLTNLQQVPVLCIGNYLEAALYGKLEFSMKFINSSCKDQELKVLLKDSHRINRSIIICKEEEVEELHEILTLKGIDNIPLLNTMSQEDIIHNERVWTESKGGAYSVLICSDFVLHTLLSVTCATTLIHYSLPKSWTKFLKRFGCLLENCRSPLDSEVAKIISRNIVLCDENCKDQMYKVFSYLNCTDLKKELPEKLQHFSETLKYAEEEHKLEREIGFCKHLKILGKCIQKQCPRRHLINPNLDVSDSLPAAGKIKFKIMNIVDVTFYCVQLLQHVDNENRVHEYEETTDITEDLSATLRLSRKKIPNPLLGHHYAFYDFDEQEGMYFRCEILDIDQDCVQIKLLDKGTIINTMVSRIYRLPKEFECKVKPPTIIDVILANYVPPYDDENFSAKSFFNLKTLIEKHNYKDIIFTGEVHLQLAGTLWLKDVCEEIALSDKIIPGFQLSREITLKKLVVSDSNQLENLYKMCTDAGIVLPKYEKPKVTILEKKEKVKLQWAHLEVDEIHEVTFSSAFSPDEIYVRLNKFSDLLYTLQKEIQQSIQKPHYPKLQEVNVGEVYLAEDPGSMEYCRVLVMKKESGKALCFQLDFGAEAVVPTEELKYIQPIFVEKLPFQSIQCRLHGIKPLSEEWEEEATNVLYDYANEPGTDIFRTLFLKVYKKESSSNGAKTRYSILLKDGFGEKKVLINQLLIDCGLVNTNIEESIGDFDIPTLPHDSPEPDEDLEKIAYICRKTDELDRYLDNNSARQEANGKYNIDEMEFFMCGDAFDFFSQLLQPPENKPVRNNHLPPITAAPQVDYYTPEVYWSQTDGNVKLSIKLIDAKDYKLSLTKGRILNFSTVKNQKKYHLKLMLYDVVETLQHTSAGPEIRITLNKMRYMEWPRLILSKQKARNIRYDITKIEDFEDENRRVLQLPKELDEGDDDDLNEDDPMYVVESDLDSDLDLELPHDSD